MYSHSANIKITIRYRARKVKLTGEMVNLRSKTLVAGISLVKVFS